ncbi:MAG: hypothetical protein ACKO8I_00130 [Cyanobacteriota bacterium]
MDELRADPHYRQVLQFIEEKDWPAAEGLLLLLRLRYGNRVVLAVDALLGYCLSMQAQHAEAWLVLEPLLTAPGRTFWVAHLGGNAQRGLGELAEAARLYQRALEEQSDSAITVRNLIQVLLQLDETAALEQLEAWQQQGPLREFVLEGVREALAGGSAPALDQWLDREGLAGPSQQRQLLEAELRRLELAAVTERLGREGWQECPWRQAMAWRLAHLGLTAWDHSSKRAW